VTRSHLSGSHRKATPFSAALPDDPAKPPADARTLPSEDNAIALTRPLSPFRIRRGCARATFGLSSATTLSPKTNRVRPSLIGGGTATRRADPNLRDIAVVPQEAVAEAVADVPIGLLFRKQLPALDGPDPHDAPGRAGAGLLALIEELDPADVALVGRKGPQLLARAGVPQPGRLVLGSCAGALGV
jgi:hypothetical protein